MDQIMGTQAMIIALDVDETLFDRLEHVLQCGFSVVEINGVNSTTLVQILATFPTLRVGAGNVISTQQLEDAYQAGAHFVTSPGFVQALAQTAQIYSVNYLPGVATLSEAMQAFSLGCHEIRPFPATVSFCRLLNKYLPLLRLFPAEIGWAEAEQFLKLSTVAGISILNPEIKQGQVQAAP